METKQLLELLGIAFKRGYIEGMNFEKGANGDDEMSHEEFEETIASDIINESIKKSSEEIIKKFNL